LLNVTQWAHLNKMIINTSKIQGDCFSST